MTRLHNRHTPARDNVPHFVSYLDNDNITLAEVLSGAGYRCGGVGKWNQPLGFHASSRVPNCKRGDDFQDLVYLNPNPSPTPIFKDEDGLPARWYDNYERVGLMKGGINNE